MNFWTGIILIFLGTVFGLGGLWSMYFDIKIRTNGLKTKATLTRIDQSSDTNYSFYTFQDINGEIHEVKSNSFMPTHKIGRLTIIHYDIKDPQKYYYLESDDLGQFVGTLIGFGMLIIGITLL